MSNTDNKLLQIEGLKVMFPIEGSFIRAVEGIDIDIDKGQCVALVGESGCGKSVTSQAIMKLLQSPPAIMDVKKMLFNDIDISLKKENEMQKIRGSSISMVFQDALTSLNPVMTIGKQIDEVFLQHKKASKKEARSHTLELLKKVGVPDGEKRYHDFPHQLSGGMRQRILIAMAIACEPQLMIADEPTTALDVTIQAQVLDLLNALRSSNNMALLIITHDLSIVANTAEKVYVMYSGKIVEKGYVKDIFKNPLHPYTKGLLNSVPRLNEEASGEGKNTRFQQIPDTVPNPANKPKGCYFHPRCKYCTEKCKKEMPMLQKVNGNREVRCWNWEENKEAGGTL